MSREQFTNDVIMFCDIHKLAFVADFMMCKIDDIINDAYDNEMDDFVIESVNDFNDFLDVAYEFCQPVIH